MKRGEKYPKTNTGAVSKKKKVGDIPASEGHNRGVKGNNCRVRTLESDNELREQEAQTEFTTEDRHNDEERTVRGFPVVEDEDIQEFPLPKAFTSEGRENQLIAAAYDLVEKRLREGTATAQETVHFLKMGSTKARLEKEILETQAELYRAKAEAYASAKRTEELYAEAIAAMRKYSGHGDYDDDEEELF